MKSEQINNIISDNENILLERYDEERWEHWDYWQWEAWMLEELLAILNNVFWVKSTDILEDWEDFKDEELSIEDWIYEYAETSWPRFKHY